MLCRNEREREQSSNISYLPEFTANVFVLDLRVIIKGIDQEIDGAFQMKRGRNLGSREKALSLVHSKDGKEKGWFQNFHTVKLGERQENWTQAVHSWQVHCL